jgi:hypothetical protein
LNGKDTKGEKYKVVNVACEEALSYMTFENGKKADEFVADCKEGKHPEVIERYKERMGLGDGKAI